MPNVQGILETALYVKDLQASVAFYRRLFAFDILLESPRLVALDIAGRDVLLLFAAGTTRTPFRTSGGVIPGHGDGGPGHLAFAISKDEIPEWKARLAAEGVPLESEVGWEGGAKSLYFRDLDDNVVELITPGFWRTY
jgi:catechol 2,3-dioxygenase-like lactoylglutathione lyase family enzyme